MPRLKVFDAPAAGGQRLRVQRATADVFGGGAAASAAGATLTAFAGELEAQNTREDVTRVNNLQPQALMELTQGITELEQTALPGAPDHVKTVTNLVTDWYDRAADQATTPEGVARLQAQRAKTLSDFQINAMAYQAASKGKAVRQGYDASVNAATTTLLQKPELLDSFIFHNKEQLEDPEGVYFQTFDANTRIQLATDYEEEATKAAVQGLIRKNPLAAQEALEAGQFDDTIDKDDIKTLIREAGAGVKAIQADARLMDQREKDAIKAAQTSTMNDFLDRMAPGAQAPLTNQDILNSNLTPPQKVTYKNLLAESTGRKKITTDSTVFIETFRRVNLPDDNPNKITDEEELNALFGKGLTLEDIKNLRKEVQDDRTPEVSVAKTLKQGLVNIAKSALTASDPLTRMRDPKGDAALQKYMSWMLPEYQRLIDKGEDPINITAVGGPLEKAIAQYTRTRQQKMKDLFDAGNPVILPEGPPETPGGTTVKEPVIDMDQVIGEPMVGPNGVIYYDYKGRWVTDQNIEFGK